MFTRLWTPSSTALNSPRRPSLPQRRPPDAAVGGGLADPWGDPLCAQLVAWLSTLHTCAPSGGESHPLLNLLDRAAASRLGEVPSQRPTEPWGASMLHRRLSVRPSVRLSLARISGSTGPLKQLPGTSCQVGPAFLPPSGAWVFYHHPSKPSCLQVCTPRAVTGLCQMPPPVTPSAWGAELTTTSPARRARPARPLSREPGAGPR